MLDMARRTHATATMERRRMREHDSSGSFDLGHRSEDGSWTHICRYHSQDDVEEAKARMADISEEDAALIGIPTDPNLEIIEN